MGAQGVGTKKQKALKITSYVINVLSIIIMLFAVFIVITSLTSKDRGYTAYFNKAYVVVQSDSMAKDLTKPDNFQKGDVIAFRLISDEEKANLKIGDVITFWDYHISTTKELNTHRIVDIREVDGVKEYSTKGDNNVAPDVYQGEIVWRKASDIQGIYAGKSSFVGKILTYLQSRTGFAIFIVVPCVLIMIYCIVIVVLNLMKFSREKAVIQHEDNVDALKAELKAQLLKEMAEQNKKETDKIESNDITDEQENEQEAPSGEDADKPNQKKGKK